VSIVVIGGGAIGLLLAGRLAQSSQHVALLARANLVETLRTQPLQLTQNNHAASIEPPPVATEPAALPADYQQPDLAILCVKGYDTDSVLPILHDLRPWQILTLQNGIGHEETLAAHFDAEHVLSGAITSSVEVEAPGRIRVTKAGGIGLASVGQVHRTRVWSAVLVNAGFQVREFRDYRALKWSKALLNMLANATPAILDMPVEDVYANRHLIGLERRAFLEALAVMRQRGIRPINLPAYPVVPLALAMRTLQPSVLVPLLRRMVAGGRGGKLPSLHADLRRGRQASEGEYLYGAVAQAARESGLAAPVNGALWHVLRGIASGEIAWDSYRRQPERLLEAAIPTKETSA
jgi:2-dehydropantoate 2-reductase